MSVSAGARMPLDGWAPWPDEAAERYVAMPDAELGAFLNTKRIAKFKLPERLELVDDLPFTNVDKIDKRRLREDIAAKLEAERA